ncbi:hypothetical protein [Mariniphaga sediminis]|uniref:hypothetical protein n=1 Tax=Mariniphaga sediminis TaxID=1628158 RepID=UPI003568217C
MSFFKKMGRGLGAFAKKVAGSALGRTVLGTAATLVGGPIAGAAVAKVTGLLGEKKTGEMASKVVGDGTVKVDKVISTLDKLGIQTDSQTVNDVAQGLKSAAMGISSQPVTISSGGFMPTYSPSGQASSSPTSFSDKVKSTWYKVKTWFAENWKKVLLYGVLPIGLIVGAYYLFGAKKKYRR